MTPSAVMPRQKPKWVNDSRSTPPEVYAALDAEFGFTFDPCPLDSSATAGASLWGKDGLAKSWAGQRVFCNPPYSDVSPWLAKASEADLAVYLLPVKSDLGWWHDQVMKATEVRFVRKRLRFGGMTGGAPFASAIVIFGLQDWPTRNYVYGACNHYSSWVRPDRVKP